MPALLMALLTLASPLPSRPVLFWGASGHRIVAGVAAERISAAARTEVSRLLGGESMIAASTWADSIRFRRPATSPWHYVNILVIDSVYQPATVCRSLCIVRAIDSQVAILRNRKLPDARRAEALRFVIHLVGDLHQPLHAGDRGDKGGNDVKVRFVRKSLTLHALWDSRLLEAMGVSDEDMTAELVRRAARRTDIATITRGTTVTWAMESHDIARDFIYRNLPNTLVYGPEYLEQARPVVEEALLRGGVRLAAVLDQALAR